MSNRTEQRESVAPGGSARVGDEVTLHNVSDSASARPRMPKKQGQRKVAQSPAGGPPTKCRPERVGDEVTPHNVSDSGSARPRMPKKQGQKRVARSPAGGPPKKNRRFRALNHSLTESDVLNIIQDSGSEVDVESDEDEDEFDSGVDLRLCRHAARRLRDRIVQEEEEIEEVGEIPGESECGREERISAAAVPLDKDFVWSDDFTSFTGQKESYQRVPGPTFSAVDPVSIFSKIWDHEFLETVVSETNKYAWGIIGPLSDPDNGKGIPRYLASWKDVTVDELYRFFAVLILMSFCCRSKIHDYWETGIMNMPAFREIISRSRFLQLSKFLHFVDNENLVSGGHARRVEKIAPVLDHCNKRFAELYIPSQHLSLDESLLLWKGRLSWKQSIRSKTARFGIKSFELCEAETGYLLQYRLYTGKGTDMHSDSLHGFRNHTAKVVLDLMEGYLDAGHVLVMDNWYNQLSLTRYLKSRRTDVLGTINRRQAGIPQAIKELIPNQVERGSIVSRHSGDIALVAWKDVKLVTLMSTYYRHEMVVGKRAGESFMRPVAVVDYNSYMGGVDLKDQKLSMFLMERKRHMKWYLKVFKKLLNTSLLNAFIIYTRHPMYRLYSHREFRRMVAEGLLRKYPRVFQMPARVSKITQERRLQPGNHFPIHTESTSSGGKQRFKQLRCVRCSALKKRVVVTTVCKLCKVPLCVGKCWEDYHTVLNLTKDRERAV